jgi:hypothetical protein
MMTTTIIGPPEEATMSKVKLRGAAAANPVSVGNTDIVNKRGVGSKTGHGFKFALQRLTLPAFRLHRYRNVSTRMLQEALYDRDCGS